MKVGHNQSRVRREGVQSGPDQEGGCIPAINRVFWKKLCCLTLKIPNKTFITMQCLIKIKSIKIMGPPESRKTSSVALQSVNTALATITSSPILFIYKISGSAAALQYSQWPSCIVTCIRNLIAFKGPRDSTSRSAWCHSSKSDCNMKIFTVMQRALSFRNHISWTCGQGRSITTPQYKYVSVGPVSCPKIFIILAVLRRSV